MKISRLFFLSVLLFLSGKSTFSQCSVTLGSDISICAEDLPVSIGNNLSITANAGYTILWDNGLGSNPNPSVSPPAGTTTYTVTLTDGACVETADIAVTVHQPIANAGPDIELCSGSTIQLNGLGSTSDTPIFDYTWGPGFLIDNDQEDSPTPFVSLNSTSALTLTIIDANFCSDQDQITVIVHDLPNVNAGSDFSLCYEGVPITEALGGSPNNGVWTGNGITDPDGEFTATQGGDFWLYYSFTDFNNCTATDSITANIQVPAVLDMGPDFGLCLNSGDVELGGTGTWSGPNVTAGGTFSPTSVGTFNLVYEETSGMCTSQDDLVITVYELPTVNAGVDDDICFGDIYTFNPIVGAGDNPIISTVWTGGPIDGVNNIEQAEATPLTTSIYALNVTDDAGCQSSDDIEITVNALPIVNAGSDIDVCEMNPAEVVTLAGFSPLPGGSESAQWIGPGIIDPDGTYEEAGIGSHTLTYEFTDANGCINSDDITVNVFVPAVLDAGPDLGLCLNSDPVDLGGTGTWTGMNVTPGGIFTPSTAGVFVLTYTEGSGVCTSSDDIEVTVYELPSVNSGIDDEICFGDTYTFNPVVGVGDNPITSTLWSGGLINGANNIEPAEANPVTTSIYTLTVTDDAGCEFSDDIEITVNALPIVNAGSDIDVCEMDPAEVVVLTGFSPLPGGGESAQWIGPGIIDPDGTYEEAGIGTHTLTYEFTDANGCVNSDDITVNVFTPDAVDLGLDFGVCLNSAPIDLGGAGTWTGTNVSPGGIFTPVSTGIFLLNYTEGNGVCSSSDDLEITVYELPSVNAGVNDAICFGDNYPLNPVVSAGDNPIISTIWSGGSINGANNMEQADADPIATSVYTLTVTDDQGCMSSDDIELTVNMLPVVDAGSDIDVCEYDTPEQVVLTGFSPIPGGLESGVWVGPGIIDPDGVYEESGIGSHSLTYEFTDANGCFSSDDININVIIPDVVDVGPDFEICQNSPAVQLTQPGTWSGTNVSPTGLFTPASTGVYTLSYEVLSGQCLSNDELGVTVLELPTADAGLDQEICINGFALVSGSGSSTNLPIVSYLWTQGENITHPDDPQTNVQPTFTQSYLLTVTDNAGCQNTDEVEITVNPLPTVDAGFDMNICDTSDPVNLSGFSPEPIGTETGIWTGTGITNPDGEFMSPGVGTYVETYTFTDAYGCVNSDNMTIDVVSPQNVDAGVQQTICLGDYDYELMNFSPTSDITWSGPGIIDTDQGIIDVMSAGDGLHTYLIEYGSGTCYVSDEVDVLIHPTPDVNAGPDEDFCEGMAEISLAGNVPVGGYWYGTGITDSGSGSFDDINGTDFYTIYYVYQDPVTTCIDTSSRVIEVHDNPIANFGLSSTQCVDVPIDLTNSSFGAVNYEWELGYNGDQSFDPEPDYSYNIEDDYIVQLIAINAFGCTDTISHSTQVVGVPVAGFSKSEDEGCTNLLVDFTNESTGFLMSYEWDFDNTQTSTSMNPPAQTFNESGNAITLYDVSLTATNLCGSNTENQTVTIHPAPVAQFNTDDDEYCGIEVQVTNTSFGEPDNHHWEWGDFSPYSVEEDPYPHNYPVMSTSESYDITLTVDNECGADSEVNTVIIHPTELTSDFDIDITEGCEPLTVNVTDESNGALSISYDFGNTDTSFDSDPTYEYTSGGLFTLTQTVSNNCGTESTSIDITVNNLPNIDFSIITLALCEGQDIEFQNNSDPLTNILWEYGDATSEADITDPVHNYAILGNYSVTLSGEAPATGCYNTYTEEIEVNPTPVSDFELDNTTGCAPYTADFVNNSIGATIYDWYFDDGDSDDVAEPTHTFINETAAPMSFFVTLLAENSSQCAHISQLEVVVNPSPSAEFTLSSMESCEFPVQVDVTNNSINADSYEWTITDNGISNSMDPTVLFGGVGTYTFDLMASNEYNCQSQSNLDFIVHPKPVIAFISDVDNGCRDLPVSFENLTTGAVEYQWDFGDGNLSSDTQPDNTYTTAGMFDVSLEATSEFGCTDTLSISNYIEVYELPIADFEYSPNVIDIYDPFVEFTDLSEGALWYEWEFGDGSSSDDIEPTYTYESSGDFPVTLTVVNQYGCADTEIKIIEITSDLTFYIPNAFTPNDDGINDVFLPVVLGAEFAEFYRLSIFNRWGILVFTTTDIEEGWRGQGLEANEYYQPDGEFIWQLELKMSENVERVKKTGKVMILR